MTGFREGSGHSFYGPPTWSRVNVAYLSLGVVYSGLLLFMLGIIWIHRHNSAVKIRGYWIMFFAVLTIQIYVAALFITYPLNGAFSCGTEFWIMNTIFPFGIAMFQVSNVRLYALFEGQRRLMANPGYWAEKKEAELKLSARRLVEWFKDRSLVQKTYLIIFICAVIQVIATLILFWGSRRFTPPSEYYQGWFGEIAGPLACRRGPEWIPSVIWQFVSAWILGPIVLYRTRHVRDTHLWALQTRVSVFASLPGTPLWLAFLYGPNETMAAINKWWPPALWFAPGLMTMQISLLVTAFIDIHNTVAPHRPITYFLNYGQLPSYDTSPRSSISKRPTRRCRELANNKEAFKFQLLNNTAPLLDFAAKRDFTAENIHFLNEVRSFKAKWTRVSGPTSYLTPDTQKLMWLEAGLIFFELVEPDTSACNINIDAIQLYELRQWFLKLEYSPPNSGRRSPKPKEENLVCPWDAPVSPQRTGDKSDASSQLVEVATNTNEIEMTAKTQSQRSLDFPGPEPLFRAASSNSEHPLSGSSPLPTIASLKEWDERRGTIDIKANSLGEEVTRALSTVPSSFSVHVFDKAERAIEYLVYMNTWKNYVETLDEYQLWAFANIDALSDQLRRDAVSKMANHNSLDKTSSPTSTHGTGSGGPEMYHGVLDEKPVPIEEINSACRCCRNKHSMPVAEPWHGRYTCCEKSTASGTTTGIEECSIEGEGGDKLTEKEASQRAKLREFAQKQFLKADELAENSKREQKRMEVLKARGAEYRDLYKAFIKKFGGF